MRVYPSLRILLHWRVNIRQVPGVLECCACCFATYRCGVVSVGVERRIEVDKVDAVVIHPSHHIEIIPLENRAVRDVAGGGLCLTCGHRVQCTPERYHPKDDGKPIIHPPSPLTLREGGEIPRCARNDMGCTGMTCAWLRPPCPVGHSPHKWGKPALNPLFWIPASAGMTWVALE